MKHCKIDIQGHRGCRGLLPENSMPAFFKALDLGVDTLELDVAVSKDKIVVVSHEPYMNPVICLDTKGDTILDEDAKKYNLYQMTLNDIQQFDCGSKYHPKFPNQEKVKTYKPSLSEVLKETKRINPAIKFNIEIKSDAEYYDVFTPKPKEFVALVLDVLNENNECNETNLQSFDLQILEEIKIQSPKMEVALLVEDNEIIIEKLNKMSYSPAIISPYYKLLNKEIVSDLKIRGFKVIPWTVNTEQDIKLMIDYNVNGIITDYPDRVINILKQ
ncbi:glycerophosphodiester phosphodiesterase family protein [Algibacter lectus]|uniref:glycerophosphodiester phosphodiesterase family protein n=1 Tax=Algibacter lectus TaxID=221126 RepID=UPI0026F24DDD|nr:glycerophosphodiester phosphodiesterase family protein [Algibacter lectus]MDO7138323.1 glycerophosphodiester phosphodiesterase family protein [Algibacter lectus]